MKPLQLLKEHRASKRDDRKVLKKHLANLFKIIKA